MITEAHKELLRPLIAANVSFDLALPGGIRLLSTDPEPTGFEATFIAILGRTGVVLHFAYEQDCFRRL